MEGRLQHLDTGTQINTVSIEIQVSQVEPVKPAKCSESINPAHVRHGDIEFSRRLMAISWRWQWCELVAAWTVCKDRKVCFKIYHNSQGVYVCNDKLVIFLPLAPIKIFWLNQPTRRDACAISAHNQARRWSLMVYPGALDRQNQVCYMCCYNCVDVGKLMLQ